MSEHLSFKVHVHLILLKFQLTVLSKTVGKKSYPTPSTSYIVTEDLLRSSGWARIDPSGSTPMICR